MSRVRAIVAAASAAGLLAAGCTVGPRYVTPQAPPTAGAPFVSATPRTAQGEGPPDAWWRLYRDPVLDGLVQQALVENNDLKVAAANLENARALLSEARSGLLPSTELSAGATYGRSAQALSLAQALGAPPPKAGWSYDAGFTAAYEVDLFGRVRRTIEAAHADAQSVEAAEDAVRTTVAADVVQAYVDLCAGAEQAAVARRSVDVAQQTYDITQRERAAGAASDLDVARAATVLQQAQAAVPAIEGQRRVVLFELTALLGKTPAQAPADAAACAAPPTLAQPLPTGDGAALLRRRPDVREAERKLAGDVARVGVATTALYPDITLNGSVNAAAATVAGLGAPANRAYGIGPLISWSFPNISLARAQIRAARATAEASLASFDSTVLTALKEAEQTLSVYAGELDRHAALTGARDQANEALRLANVQYKAGSVSFLDLLQAETTAIAADQALAASDQARASDQVAVFKALGGGWAQAPKVEPEAFGK